MTFLKHLPIPSSIPDGVLLLVVGQPANLYSSYPQWLKREHVGVEVIDVPNLDIEDISFLLRYKTSFSEHEVLVLANEVFGMTKGNTLSVVYAVHAIAGETDCGSAVEKLRSSGLSDNMEEYYESLWFKVNEEIQRQHGPGSNALDLLAASMHLLDGAVYPKLLCRAFPEVFSQEYVAKQDIAILEPLMRICADGSSRPLHNDFRLFVSSKARRAGMEDCVRLASSRLADAVLKMDGDVVRSCYSVRLLACSGRIQECIRLFDTSYIIDAVAQGVPWQLLREQAKTVYMLACESGELESVFRVQLALSTLSQVNEHFDYQLERRPFLHFEGLVGMDYLTPPFEAQTVPLYTMTLDRCLWLIESVGCEDEGFELYDAWFSSLTPLKAAEILSGPDGDSYHRQQEDGSSMLMDAWGELAAARGLDCEDITAGSGSTSGSRELLSRFWDAYVRGSLRWCPPSEDLGLRISDISISEEAASDMMGDVLSGALPASRAGRCTFFSRLSIHAFKRSLGTLAYVLCLSEGLSVPDIERGEPLLSQRVGGFYGKEFALGLFAESYVFGYETDCDDFASVICAMEASISWVDSSKREFLSIVRTLRAAACLGYSMAHREAILPGTPEALVLEEWTESRSWSGVLTIASCAMTYMSLVTEDGAALCGRALDTEDLESFVASARPLCEKLRVLEHFRKTNDDALKRFLSRTYGPDGSILLTSQEAKEVHELLRPLLSHCDQGLAERCDNAILSGSAGFTDHKDYSLSNLVELFDRLTELGLATEIQACSLLEIDSAATLSGDNRMSGELVESVASWAVARGPSQLSRIRSCRPEYKYDYALVEHQLISLLKTSGCLDDVIAVFAGLFGHTPCYSTGDIKSLRAHLDCCKCRAAELCCEKDFLSTVSDIENAISDAPKCELMKPELKRNDAEASLCCNALTDDELRNVAFAREVTHWQWEPVTEACSEMRERSWDKHEIYNQLAETRGRTLSKEGWVHSSSSVTKLIDDIARYAGDSSFFKMLSYRNEDLDRYGFSSASVDIAHALMVRAREKCPAFLVTMFELESDSKRKWVSCNGRCELPAVEPEASNLSAPESLAELVTDMLLDSVVPQDPHRTEDAVRGITWGGIRLAGMRSRTCEALPGLDPYGRMLLEKVLDCWLHKDPEDSVIANCLVGLIDVVERADEALLLSIIIEAPGLILKPDVGEPKSIGDENSEVPSRIERFLMDAQMLCNDECGDIRAAIKSSYQGEKGLCIKQYMRADEVSLPIFQIDDYCQELLYFEMCRGRWKEIPAAYAASLLIDPADVWVFSRIPVFKDSAEMGVSEAIRLFESGDTHIALDHVNGLPMHGLHQGEACLGWKIYIPYGNQDQYEFYSNARIAPLEQYDPDNVVDGEFGCYGVLARVDGGEASRFSTNSVSLCNAVAGCLTMTFCDCQIFPAFAMREFGFEPLVNNPLVWIDGLGNRVAWFERYVFPVERDYHSSAYYRQPQLWRWVCDVELVKKVVLARGFRVYWATEVNSHVDQIKERYDTQEALKKKSPFDKSVL